MPGEPGDGTLAPAMEVRVLTTGPLGDADIDRLGAVGDPVCECVNRGHSTRKCVFK